MKKTVLTFIISLFILYVYGQEFSDYFTTQQLRFDYIHGGDSNHDNYFFKEIFQEPYWGGPQTLQPDNSKYGLYKFKLIDIASGNIIYSQGYNTLFSEWQVTPEAKKLSKAMVESVIMPFPKNDVRIELYKRNIATGEDILMMEYTINPNSKFINKKSSSEYETVEILNNGNPEECIDLVLLPEGYCETEMNAFISSCQTLTDALFEISPYKEYKEKFNVWAVKAPSVESGIDVPYMNVWKNTIFNSNFSTFDIDRYCMTEDYASVRNVASSVPYDYVYVVVNTDIYGGGAIYNWYGMSSANMAIGGYVLAHELGHLFAGLGDEYEGEDAFSEMYPLNVEPFDANLTTLVDFASKWADLVEEDTPVPTPITPQFVNKVGAFEGGGYVSNGVYRPYQNCMMRNYAPFCPVCLRTMCKIFDNLTGVETESIKESNIDKETKIVLHPNPTKNYLYFSSNMGNGKTYNVIISDINGKTVNQQDVTDKIDVKNLLTGTYIISFYQDKQLIETLRFIKNK